MAAFKTTTTIIQSGEAPFQQARSLHPYFHLTAVRLWVGRAEVAYDPWCVLRLCSEAMRTLAELMGRKSDFHATMLAAIAFAALMGWPSCIVADCPAVPVVLSGCMLFYALSEVLRRFWVPAATLFWAALSDGYGGYACCVEYSLEFLFGAAMLIAPLAAENTRLFILLEMVQVVFWPDCAVHIVRQVLTRTAKSKVSLHNPSFTIFIFPILTVLTFSLRLETRFFCRNTPWSLLGKIWSLHDLLPSVFSYYSAPLSLISMTTALLGSSLPFLSLKVHLLIL